MHIVSSGYQNLFSGKSEEIIVSPSPAELTQRVVKVNLHTETLYIVPS